MVELGMEGCPMSDMHLKEKMRKVTEAAKQGAYVPERSKKAGLILFLLFLGLALLFFSH